MDGLARSVWRTDAVAPRTATLSACRRTFAGAATRAGLCAWAMGTENTCVGAPGSPASPTATGAKGGATKTVTRFCVPRQGAGPGRRPAKGLSNFDSGTPTAAWIGSGSPADQGTVKI